MLSRAIQVQRVGGQCLERGCNSGLLRTRDQILGDLIGLMDGTMTTVRLGTALLCHAIYEVDI
jgi:hypothetical protein